MSCIAYVQKGMLAAIAAGLLFTLNACNKRPIAALAKQYNGALAVSSDKVLFLNALRASRGYPLYFSQIASVSGQSRFASASGSVRVPFGRATTMPFTGSPDGSVRSPIKTMSVKNVYSGKFAQGLITPIQFPIFNAYKSTGDWPKPVIDMVLLSRLYINKSDLALLKTNSQQRCQRNRHSHESVCYHIQKTYKKCGFKSVRVGQTYLFSNNPDDQCEFMRFHAVSQMLIMTRPLFGEFKRKVATDEKTVEIVKLSDSNGDPIVRGPGNWTSKTKGYPTDKEHYSYQIFDSILGNVVGEGIRRTTTKKVKKTKQLGVKITFNIMCAGKTLIVDGKLRKCAPGKITKVERDFAVSSNLVCTSNVGAKTTARANCLTRQSSFELRSPGDMIRYVGKLIAAQLREDNPYTPEIVAGGDHTVPLFLVNRSQLGVPAALRVRFEHQGYTIPHTEFDGTATHQSLRVLAMISQILSFQTTAEALKPSTVTLN